ncbi:MAG: hypothetical protein DDG58_00455 [Ardenticatenia bacterium]|jgi:gas vesicle protein|nr:MAG: hypothetical protein DDG58_00455 [Ardenticatenia bacterium]
MRFFRFVAGFSIGLALGWAMAVLFAPQSGRDVRRRLQERWMRTLEEARSAAEETRQQAYIRLAELRASESR